MKRADADESHLDECIYHEYKINNLWERMESIMLRSEEDALKECAVDIECFRSELKKANK